MDMIWYDSEVLNGRGTRSDYSADLEVIKSPKNVREAPCIGCSRAKACAAEQVDCAAFRNWTNRGDYRTQRVGLLLKAI